MDFVFSNVMNIVAKPTTSPLSQSEQVDKADLYQEQPGQTSRQQGGTSHTKNEVQGCHASALPKGQ